MSEFDQYLLATVVGISMGYIIRAIVDNFKNKIRSKIRSKI